MTRKFKKIGLWGRLSEANVADPALQISTHLRELGLEVYTVSQTSRVSALRSVPRLSQSEIAKRVDLLVAIGGDGNLLRAARRAAEHNVPLLGVNRGRLGFLTDISPDHMLEAIDAILAGDYLAEDRQMLEATLTRGKARGQTMYALNDVVLQKGDSGRIMEFVTTVDGSHLNTHGGDGLIVSTATGSTAYALSCGGPIIQPDVDALVMIPICPHTLSDRPLVLRGSSKIEVKMVPGNDYRAHVACDGDDLGRLTDDATLHVRAAERRVTLLHPRDYNYYELLRSKLNWGRANRAET
jgi:NAD+ kinase